MSAATPFWLSIFIDLTAEEYDAGVAFWRGVTGYGLSSARGENDEFASLTPPDGDVHLRVQRLVDGASGAHLDLHVHDADAAADIAEELGATVVARPGHVILRSPGGLPFCFVVDPDTRAAAPARWPDGHRSRVDQLCLDIPGEAYDEECAFWSRLTGWELRGAALPSFTRLATPPALPVRILLQRREEGDGPVTGHLDIATDDRPAETERMAGLGAGVDHIGAFWTRLRPPIGPLACVTDRNPQTGLV